MSTDFTRSQRSEALRMAIDIRRGDETPEQLVENAETFLAFVTGETPTE